MHLWTSLASEEPISSDYSSILYPIIIALYMTTVPFLSLFQAFKLDYIDKNNIFRIIC